MTNFKKILATLAVLSTAAILCGCTEQETEYNYDLLGGEVISNSDYNVDIRKDNTDETDKADEQNSTPTSAPDVTTSNTDTTSTPSAQPTTPTRPAQSTKPTETSEPTTSTDTAPDETSKVETTEKEDTTTSSTSTPTQKYDANGFPANPTPFQSYVDTTGQRWEYDCFAGWCKAGGGGVEVTDFWTGEQILF